MLKIRLPAQPPRRLQTASTQSMRWLGLFRGNGCLENAESYDEDMPLLLPKLMIPSRH
jgi:hypothetical protein